MTEKQEKILNTALQLFAKQGYTSTSTSKVAKAADVSEGLIFRHFKNKEGLLNAILQQGHEKLGEIVSSLSQTNNPKQVIQYVIEIPFHISEDEKPFWKLLYALKWQAEVYDDSMSSPIKELLINACQKLNYDNPKAEAETILILMDGLATAILLRKPKGLEGIKQSILKKYDL